MNVTAPAELTREVVGFIVNAGFSQNSRSVIQIIQQQLAQALPDLLWLPLGDALHITLLDLLSPLVTYSKDKDILFGELRSDYINTLTNILQRQQPVYVTFDTLEVHPNAIIIKGHDSGEYAKIRSQFLSQAELLAGTKIPPSIIHSTIAKFTKEISLNDAQRATQGIKVLFTEPVQLFRLVREDIVFMQSFKLLHEFKLGQT